MCFVTVSILFGRLCIARDLAIISAFWGLSAFMGPLIGGLFIEFANWRLGFGFFGLKAIGLAVWIGFHAPHGRQADQREDPKIRLPAARLALLSASILSVAIAGINVGPITSPVLIGIGLIAFVLFLRRDALAGDHSRLLPYAPLNPRTPAGATLSMILALSIATIPITASGPLLISAIHNPSALTIGYIVACSSIGWTITAIAVSSAPERLDALLITLGILLVILSIPGFIVTIPRGPLWLIAACAILEGGGFGIAWTFILRRTTALSPPEETQRIAGALPTIQRFGYAIGAAYIGLIANTAGFLEMSTPDHARSVAQIVFLACVPPALFSIPGLWGLVRPQPEFSLLK